MKEMQLMPVSDIMKMAQTFAESGMFTDAKSMGQAFVKIQAGQEIGIPPFAAMSGIHIIQGKPTIGAGLIASTVKGSGKYDYKVIKLDDKICSIDFYQGESNIGNSTFTIEDAKKALTKNIDKFPKNMLFARAISNGVKWFCPDVFSGPIYVPEEIQQTIDVESVVIPDQLPILEGEKLSKAIELLKVKAYTVDQIKVKYSLSPEVEAELNNYYNNGY
jgi:hypothetical protein